MINAPEPGEWGWIETTEKFYPMWTSIDTLSWKLTHLEYVDVKLNVSLHVPVVF